ncbi:MAG: hypothetical protein M3162_04670 [Thermoproteota archaeon]|nr:hypothetical protein [Thermoproteota archaeon]
MPSAGDWCLRDFDCNKDIPAKTLEEKYSGMGISWRPKDVPRLKHVGDIFPVCC